MHTKVYGYRLIANVNFNNPIKSYIIIFTKYHMCHDYMLPECKQVFPAFPLQHSVWLCGAGSLVCAGKYLPLLFPKSDLKSYTLHSFFFFTYISMNVTTAFLYIIFFFTGCIKFSLHDSCNKSVLTLGLLIWHNMWHRFQAQS